MDRIQFRLNFGHLRLQLIHSGLQLTNRVILACRSFLCRHMSRAAKQHQGKKVYPPSSANFAFPELRISFEALGN